MSDTAIDLRSDTVTQPTAAMRAAMAAAPVGDDQFGEDPTVNLLQERIAETLGKEAALWLPSGTMANQVALRVLTRPGDDVIVSRQCHAVLHETGASGANAGVQFTEIGQAGVFSREEFVTAWPEGVDAGRCLGRETTRLSQRSAFESRRAQHRWARHQGIGARPADGRNPLKRCPRQVHPISLRGSG
jgi:hypothetical protein